MKCMQTNFGGCSLSGLEILLLFKNGQISLSDHGIVHRGQKIESAQKIHTSRG